LLSSSTRPQCADAVSTLMKEY